MTGGNAKQSLIEHIGPKQLAFEEIDESLIRPV
jgi:hypothetical protein